MKKFMKRSLIFFIVTSLLVCFFSSCQESSRYPNAKFYPRKTKGEISNLYRTEDGELIDLTTLKMCAASRGISYAYSFEELEEDYRKHDTDFILQITATDYPTESFHPGKLYSPYSTIVCRVDKIFHQGSALKMEVGQEYTFKFFPSAYFAYRSGATSKSEENGEYILYIHRNESFLRKGGTYIVYGHNQMLDTLNGVVELSSVEDQMAFYEPFQIFYGGHKSIFENKNGQDFAYAYDSKTRLAILKKYYLNEE